MNETNPYAPPEAAVVDIGAQTEAPALWNPGAATAWCLLFTPTFGAILQMKNWHALGEPAKAARSRAWAIGTAVFTVLVAIAGVALPVSLAIDRALNVSSFVLLLVWYFADGREQVTFVKARFGAGYPRRRWMMPLLIAFVVFVAFSLLAIAAMFVVMSARGEL